MNELNTTILVKCPKCQATTWQLVLPDPDYDADEIILQCTNCHASYSDIDFGLNPGVKSVMPWF